MDNVADACLVDRSVSLAGDIMTAAAKRTPRREAAKQRRLARLLEDADSFGLTIVLTDTVLRVTNTARAADLFTDTIKRFGVGPAFGAIDALALRAGAALARPMHWVVMPLVKRRVRLEATGVIFPAESAPLSRHLAARKGAGLTANINVLGEAILGESEALRRLTAVSEMLQRPDVGYVSIKVSAVASQLESFAFEQSVTRVVERLIPLYRIAASHETHKFINLDMEEFRDLDLTIEVFTRILDQPEFDDLEAGIVLQAYLPDAHDAYRRLQQWARARHARTGTGIKVRIVKGANLAMEQVDAELHGWNQAPYGTKLEVDASWKRLVDSALHRDATASIRIGIASHNLFDVAFALLLAQDRGVSGRVDIEMLEGMAMAAAREIHRRGANVILYTPVTEADDFVVAVAYLVRRLDENAAPENYLRVAGTIKPGTTQFTEQAERFREACELRHTINTDSRRATAGSASVHPGRSFTNTPDTDLAVASNRDTVNAAVGRWQTRDLVHPLPANVSDVNDAVERARRAVSTWAARGVGERRAILDNVAYVMHEQRPETIGCMVREAAKTVAEADPEVSEAIDFARYYAVSAEQLSSDVTLVTGSPLGVVVVAPPWNFPYAIAAGGVCAALAAGNTVILKPAPEAMLTGMLLAEHLWAGGVPRDVLQCLSVPDNEVGQRLITHENVDAVVLTGAYETAEMFLGWKPSLRLIAETSGKNAIIITAAADIDVAVKDLVKSAFGHAGQKCSAASLAIVEAAVYDGSVFLRQLQDAVRSLHVGAADDPVTAVGPVISEPNGSLLRVLTQLDPGESWLVEPRCQAGTMLWSPGVKLGVQPGSWSHHNEWFGPVLGVMRAPDLDTAIAWQNGTDYGLTGGIHSLDVDEVTTWVNTVQVGNAYVNRATTGAVVQRQPFGGWKKSSIGAGAKAGGPNYVAAFQQWRPTTPLAATDAAIARQSFATWHHDHFGLMHDPSGLRSELNVFRYQPHEHPIVIRTDHATDNALVDIALAAAQTCGAAVEVSSSDTETDAELFARLEPRTRIRMIEPPSESTRRDALACGLVIDDSHVVADGRIELLHWQREQAISITNHRYGNRGIAPIPAGIVVPRVDTH